MSTPWANWTPSGSQRTAQHAASFKENLETRWRRCSSSWSKSIGGSRSRAPGSTASSAWPRAATLASRPPMMPRLGWRSSSSCGSSASAVSPSSRSAGAAAERGVFITADGTDPGGPTEAGTSCGATSHGTSQLAEAEATLANARDVAEVTPRRSSAPVSACVDRAAGSLIWSVFVGADDGRVPGSPVAEWLDCSVMLVDVPVSDVEVALLRPGMIGHGGAGRRREARRPQRSC